MTKLPPIKIVLWRNGVFMVIMYKRMFFFVSYEGEIKSTDFITLIIIIIIIIIIPISDLVLAWLNGKDSV